MKRFNQIYEGSKNRKALYDVYLTSNESEWMTVFVHGYMGYKDWGAWNLLCEKLQEKGHSIAALNLTSNGTTIENSTEFVDLNAFGTGGYFQELMDVRLFLTHLESTYKCTKFRLIGHSRGGGIVLLAALDEKVKELHCLAPISSIENRFPSGDALEKWKTEGVYFRKNGRTRQEMPHNYTQYEDFLVHKEALNIENACKKLNIPVFVYHGEHDQSVLPEEGKLIAKWTKGTFHLVKNTAHTFDTKEPWNDKNMPLKMKELVDAMLSNIHTERSK